MKKLFAIAFTCVYLTLAVGVVHTTHYCMGRVKSSTLFSFDSVKCPCFVFAKDGDKTCCNDEHEVIKIEDDHSGAMVLSLVAEYFELGHVFQSAIAQSPSANPISRVYESPPPLSTVPLFERHCSLVFYDGMMS